MDPVLAIHVAAGGLGLVVLVPVLTARKRRRGWHGRLGKVFVGLAAVVAVTALWLVAHRPTELLGLGILGVLTGLWAGGGLWVAMRRPRLPGGWLRWHIPLMGSAAIAFVTAFAVQVADGHLAAWIVPTLVGSPLVNRAVLRWTVPGRGPSPAGRRARRAVPD